jgi:hypothetical protein
MCFLLFEGVVALAILLSLAELVNWLSVLVLPAIVAGLVKINDIVAGAFSRIPAIDSTMRFTTRKRLGEARGMAAVPQRWDSQLELESETQVLPRGHRNLEPLDAPEPEPSTRAERRKATNQRRFAPVSTTDGQKKAW